GATLDFEEIASCGDRQNCLAEAWNRPFNLNQAPLFCARVFTLSPENRVLLIVLHHLIADFASLQVLIREFAKSYQGVAADGVPFSHLDAAQRHASRLASDGDRLAGYWLARLADPPPPLQIPTDRQRPTVIGGSGGTCFLRLRSGVAKQVKSVGRAHGTTPFMVLLAAFKALLYRYSGQSDLV